MLCSDKTSDWWRNVELKSVRFKRSPRCRALPRPFVRFARTSIIQGMSRPPLGRRCGVHSARLAQPPRITVRRVGWRWMRWMGWVWDPRMNGCEWNHCTDGLDKWVKLDGWTGIETQSVIIHPSVHHSHRSPIIEWIHSRIDWCGCRAGGWITSTVIRCCGEHFLNVGYGCTLNCLLVVFEPLMEIMWKTVDHLS